MGSRGPTPKTDSPVRFTLGVPEPSSRLSEAARAEYSRIVAICKESDRELQHPDMAVLEIYAQSFADYWRLDALIVTDGDLKLCANGFYQLNPLCRLREDAWKRLLAAAAKLGFSPADRARVVKTTPDGKADPLAAFSK